MKKFKNVLIGLCFIAVGVLFGLKTLGYTDIDILERLLYQNNNCVEIKGLNKL